MNASGPVSDPNPAAAVLASCCNCDSAAILGANAAVFIGVPINGSNFLVNAVSAPSNIGAGNTCDIVVGYAIMLLPLIYALNYTFVLRLY